MQGITRFSTGFPVQMNQSEDDLTLWGSSSTDMPNRVGPVHILNPHDANPNCPTSDGTGCYFLSDAFEVNTIPGTFGTANRRFFHGPGFNNTDFGVLKHTTIKFGSNSSISSTIPNSRTPGETSATRRLVSSPARVIPGLGSSVLSSIGSTA